MANRKSPCKKECEKRVVGCRKTCTEWLEYEKDYLEQHKTREPSAEEKAQQYFSDKKWDREMKKIRKKQNKIKR